MDYSKYTRRWSASSERRHKSSCKSLIQSDCFNRFFCQWKHTLAMLCAVVVVCVLMPAQITAETTTLPDVEQLVDFTTIETSTFNTINSITTQAMNETTTAAHSEDNNQTDDVREWTNLANTQVSAEATKNYVENEISPVLSEENNENNKDELKHDKSMENDENEIIIDKEIMKDILVKSNNDINDNSLNSSDSKTSDYDEFNNVEKPQSTEKVEPIELHANDVPLHIETNHESDEVRDARNIKLDQTLLATMINNSNSNEGVTQEHKIVESPLENVNDAPNHENHLPPLQSLDNAINYAENVLNGNTLEETDSAHVVTNSSTLSEVSTSNSSDSSSSESLSNSAENSDSDSANESNESNEIKKFDSEEAVKDSALPPVVDLYENSNEIVINPSENLNTLDNAVSNSKDFVQHIENKDESFKRMHNNAPEETTSTFVGSTTQKSTPITTTLASNAEIGNENLSIIFDETVEITELPSQEMQENIENFMSVNLATRIPDTEDQTKAPEENQHNIIKKPGVIIDLAELEKMNESYELDDLESSLLEPENHNNVNMEKLANSEPEIENKAVDQIITSTSEHPEILKTNAHSEQIENFEHTDSLQETINEEIFKHIEITVAAATTTADTPIATIATVTENEQIELHATEPDEAINETKTTTIASIALASAPAEETTENENVYRTEAAVPSTTTSEFITSKGSRSVNRPLNVLTQLDEAAATLFEAYPPHVAGQTFNDNLADERVADIGKALQAHSVDANAYVMSGSAVIIAVCSSIAVLFIIISVTIFLVSFQKQHGTLDIEMQEQRCGKDNLHEEDAETFMKLLEIELPKTSVNIMAEETDECL